MNEKIGEYLNQVYEILLRTLAFLVMSLGVTYLMTYDPLTGLIWVTVNHIVYGSILADITLLIAIPFFSPATVGEALVNIHLWYFKARIEWEGNPEEKTVKDNALPPDDVIRSAERVIGKLIDSDFEPLLSTAVKSAYDGLQTAVAMLDDPETLEAYQGKPLGEPTDDSEFDEGPWDVPNVEDLKKHVTSETPYEDIMLDGRMQRAPVLEVETVEEKSVEQGS